MPWSENLSEREMEILRLAATGASNKVIAGQLGISPNTVKVHLKKVFDKIGAASRTEAAYLYHQHISGEQPPNPAVSAPLLQQRIWLPGSFLLILVILAVIFFGLRGQRLPALILASSPTARPPVAASRWQALAPLPQGRAAMAAVVYESSIYIISGEGPLGLTPSHLSFDTHKSAWQERAPIPLAVSEVSAALLEEKIYVPGGKLAGGDITNRMQVYDPRQDRWADGLPLPHPSTGYALVVLDGKIYLFGGWDGKNYLSSIYQYSPDHPAWVEIAALPHPLAYAGAVAVQDKIIIFGGLNSQGAQRANLAFYPGRAGSASAWQELEPLPLARYAVGAAGLVNQIYLAGGKGDRENETLPPLQYSLQANHWQSFEAPPQPDGEFPALLAVETRLALIGGRMGNSFSSHQQAYQAIYTLLIPMIESQ